MPRLLAYRAGPLALQRLRESGLVAEQISCLAGAASGPRWLALGALDMALVSAGLLEGRRDGSRGLLVGASAGAWRMLALAAPDAAAAHRQLVHGYTHQTFARQDTPRTVSAAYRRMLGDLLTEDRVRQILDHPRWNVALQVTRLRRLAPRWGRAAQATVMMLGAALNAASRRMLGGLFERVMMHPRPAEFTAGFDGSVVALTERNLLDASLASGTVPFYMDPVRGIAGAPGGCFVDGGITDYHLRQDYSSDTGTITLFPHFQKAITPVWFDRAWPSRQPDTAALAHVLQLYPTPDFLARLPDGKLPDRDDFLRFADDPAERIRRWKAATTTGEALAEQFLEDLGTGRLLDLVQPMQERGQV